jgi:hypothetical protein
MIGPKSIVLVVVLVWIWSPSPRAQAQQSPKGAPDSANATVHDTSAARTDSARLQKDSIPTSVWGSFDPGNGFVVGKTSLGALAISGYVLFRYLNQLPASQTYLPYQGPALSVNTRNDLQLQRIMMFFNGWLFKPRFGYTVILWSVNSIAQVAVGGNIRWTFNKYFTLYGGTGGLPGSRSMVGVFPYFLATDRVLTDEFFRPSFTGGVWANGQLYFPALSYAVMLGNNLGSIGVNAAKLNRDLAKSASVFWEPTTGEFGERGGFGDFERHEHVATRFGASYTWSREDRRSDLSLTAPDNTQIRLSDAIPLFLTGAVTPGVTIKVADYSLVAFDAAMKYNGWFLYAQGYFRRLDRLMASGPLPLAHILDNGFDTQAAYMVVPQTVMLFAWTSQLFGQFNKSWELAGGINYFPFQMRNFRVNATAIYVDHSAWNSVSGYYTAGQTGPTFSLAADAFF